MPSADSTPRSGIKPESQILPIHRPDTALFGTLDGLVEMTGEPASRLRDIMAKELADNALDACDAAGRSGQAAIRKRGSDTYIVIDQGNGIAGTPADLAALFSIHRPMISTKYLRKPERGALGNGLRIIVGCVVASRGTIEVITRGRRVMLRPRRADSTEIVSVSEAPGATGTTLTVTLSPTIPYSWHDDLASAQAAIDLAERAEGPPYARQPSPQWIDFDAFTDMLALIQPDSVTVRQVIELFDGCTGRKASKLAEPFGKGRLARGMSEDEAAALLTSMQATAREVKHTALCPIGPNAYDPEDYDYARAGGIFRHGGHEPRATIPYIVEAWVSAKSRKGKSAEIDQVFANRTPIVGDAIRAHRSVYFDKELMLAGCGLDGVTFDDWPLGDFTAKLHVISPLIPRLSAGKRPNLRQFRLEIDAALRRALKRSRDRLPPDTREPKAPPPPKPPRPPKVEPPPKPPREGHQPRGVLGQLIAAAAKAAGLHVNDLRVMSPRRDPFTVDTAANHRIGKWFAEQVDRFVHSQPTVHLRGLHYILSSTAAIVRPDGRLYVNDHSCWSWLQDRAAKAAKWLDHVPFDRIHDARNEDPIWCALSPAGMVSSYGKRGVSVDVRSLGIEVPGVDDVLPYVEISGGRRPVQPYRLGLIGEKSSLRPIVEPIAETYHMDVVLDTGDASDSHLYEMAERASQDSRPFVVFYLSDFDPGGHNMPTSVARKFQALRALHFPDLDLRLYPVALTLEQCIAFDLPSAPLKPSEKRKAKWLAQTGGREQTELDALMALRPGELEKLLTAAIEPFFDPTLQQRFNKANAMPAEVQAWFDALPACAGAVEKITPLRDAAAQAADALKKAVEEHAEAVRKAVREAEDAPKLEPIDVTPEIAIAPPEPMFHTRDDFLTATRKLIARRDGVEGGGDDASSDSDEEEDEA